MQLVVSYYKENASWLENVPSHWDVVVYIKCYRSELISSPNYLSIKKRANSIHFLPNVGRESQTFFHHIVNNYDVLDDTTCFCQGWPFDHVDYFSDLMKKKNIFDMAEVVSLNSKNDFLLPDIGYLPFGTSWIHSFERRNLPDFCFFEKIYSKMIWKCILATELPKYQRTIHGGQYVATNSFLRRVPRKVFEQLLNFHLYDRWSFSGNWIVPWSMEKILPEMYVSLYNQRLHLL